MKDGLMLLAGAVLVFGLIIFGINQFTQSHYSAPEKTQNEINQAHEQRMTRRQQMKDVEQRRKDLMRQQKQKIRDLQRR